MMALEKRVEKLEIQEDTRQLPLITVRIGENLDQAKERHFQEHPEDREGRLFVDIP
jgi:hypothetical protein